MNVRLSDEAIKLIERGFVWICEHLGSCYQITNTLCVEEKRGS